jgi:hypothetical protein
MREDSNIAFLIALRVLSEQQSLLPPNHMTAAALRTLAETDQERKMSLADLACAVLAREPASAEMHAISGEHDDLNLPQRKLPASEGFRAEINETFPAAKIRTKSQAA